MDFVHYELGHLSAGTVVEVTLDTAANVLLLEDAAFRAYSRGNEFSYYGGHATQSPYRLQAPRAAIWHVAIDLGGYPGQVRSGVRVLPR